MKKTIIATITIITLLSPLLILAKPVSAGIDCAHLNQVYGISSTDYNNCMAIEGNYDSTISGKGKAFEGRCEDFLGMVSWDCNVDIHDEESLKSGIWIIVSNIASDIAIAASYLLIGYVIYGGYLYVFSRGEPGKIAEGKKTLAQSFIGFGVVMFAAIILNSIRIALGNVAYTQNCATNNCIANPSEVVIGFINWVIGIAGVMSVIFIVYGGILYITSTGDPGRVKQAKNMIIYSLIGLAIVALSATITALVSRSIRDASESAFIYNSLISKEVHEIKNN